MTTAVPEKCENGVLRNGEHAQVNIIFRSTVSKVVCYKVKSKHRINLVKIPTNSNKLIARKS